MAHIPPSAAIFSPSIARLASSTAKDWSYVDSWLATKFLGRSPPSFERTPEILKFLVTLAASNEMADEDRALVISVEASALKTLARTTIDESHASSNDKLDPTAMAMSPAMVAETIMAAFEGSLSREGRSALNALANTSVEFGVAYPTPTLLGRNFAELQTRRFRLQQALERTTILSEYIKDEAKRLQTVLRVQGSEGYRPLPSLAKVNLDLQRRVKKETGRIHEAREKSSDLHQLPVTTVQQMEEEEAVHLELLAYGKTLDKQIEYFEGLPPDKVLARQQLEALRAELQTVTQRRDVVFEALVEKATPKRSR